MSRPLEGVRAVDATTGIAGAYAGKLLVDAGADVVRAAPDGLDPLVDLEALRDLGERGIVGRRIPGA